MSTYTPPDKIEIYAAALQSDIKAEREAAHYLGQYANDDTGFRFEVFEVTRKSLGGLGCCLTPNAIYTARPAV